MKILKTLIAVILFFSFISFAESSERENFYGIRYDYLLHYQTGSLMALTLDQWFENDIITFGLPFLASFAKEYIDYARNDDILTEDFYKDIGFTMLGAISGKILSFSF
jgi:hypothetical protein